MKVIDLLNKIANGEEVPEKINYLGIEYKLMHQDYKDESRDIYLFSEEIRDILDILNDTVEIIEDKEDINIQDIEELPETIYTGNGGADLKDGVNAKINEIIRAVKYLEKTKEDK